MTAFSVYAADFFPFETWSQVVSQGLLQQEQCFVVLDATQLWLEVQ